MCLVSAKHSRAVHIRRRRGLADGRNDRGAAGQSDAEAIFGDDKFGGAAIQHRLAKVCDGCLGGADGGRGASEPFRKAGIRPPLWLRGLRPVRRFARCAEIDSPVS
jgi:hypothetical protein